MMRIGVLSWLVCLLFSVNGLSAQQHGPYPVRTLTNDGAWTWFNDERCIVEDTCFIIASVDSEGYSRVDVVPVDVNNGSLVARSYRLSSWQSRDDHDVPSLLKLSNGRLLAAYAKHHLEPVWYWRTADVHRTTEGIELTWEAEHRVDVPAKSTYNNLFQLSEEKGRVYNFIRSIGFNPNLLYSDDQGRTWEGPWVLIQSGDDSTRPYVKYAGNGRDRIDFLYTDGHPRKEPTNSVYHLYYQDGYFCRSDGTRIKTLDQLKVQPLVPSDGTRIYDGSTGTGRGWVWDFEYDNEGQPVAVYINSVDGAKGKDLRYRYARWDAQRKQWSEGQIAFGGTHLYVPENHYAGGIAIDPENIDVVYISTNVDPVDGKPLASGHYQIFRGKTSDRGRSWQWRQLTFDQDRDNLRPICPRQHGCQICVIWFAGQYNTYTDFNAKIMGIIVL